MKSRNKYLCWVLLLIMLCVVSYGGCGGDSETTQSEEQINNAPEEHNQDTPQGQETQVIQENNNNDNSVGGDINGTWRIDSGFWYYKSSETESLTYKYVEGSASASVFEIAVNKNTDDEYYTLKLIGNGVEERVRKNHPLHPDSDMITWEIKYKCKLDGVDIPPLLEEYYIMDFEPSLYGSNYFKHPDNNSWVSDLFEASTDTFTVMDNETVIYRKNGFYNGPSDYGYSVGYDGYGEFTLKRVR